MQRCDHETNGFIDDPDVDATELVVTTHYFEPKRKMGYHVPQARKLMGKFRQTNRMLEHAYDPHRITSAYTQITDELFNTLPRVRKTWYVFEEV